MKTGLETLQDVRSLINLPQVTSAITGGIYQVKAPLNSKLIDIVIGLQGIDNDQIQQATINVNIHVPNMKSDATMPDLATLDRLIKLLTPLLDTQFRDSFHVDIASPAVIYQDTDGSYFANIKLNYYSIQTNFKNL